MNCFRPSTVIPLLRTPLTVGKRGSSLEEEMGKVNRGRGGICGEKEEVVEVINSLYTPYSHITKHQSADKLNLPSINVSLVDKPGELPLGQHCVVKVESGVLPDVGLPEAQGVDYPVELLVTVVVLSGPESMGHTLQTVHDGTGKVVCWVNSGKKKKRERDSLNK